VNDDFFVIDRLHAKDVLDTDSRLFTYQFRRGTYMRSAKVTASFVGVLLAMLTCVTSVYAAPSQMKDAQAARAYLRIACPYNVALEKYGQTVYDGWRGDVSLSEAKSASAKLLYAGTSARRQLKVLAREVRPAVAERIRALVSTQGEVNRFRGKLASARDQVSYSRTYSNYVEWYDGQSHNEGNLIREILSLPTDAWCPRS